MPAASQMRARSTALPQENQIRLCLRYLIELTCPVKWHSTHRVEFVRNSAGVDFSPQAAPTQLWDFRHTLLEVVKQFGGEFEVQLTARMGGRRQGPQTIDIAGELILQGHLSVRLQAGLKLGGHHRRVHV